MKLLSAACVDDIMQHKQKMKCNAGGLGHFFCNMKAELSRGQPGLMR